MTVAIFGREFNAANGGKLLTLLKSLGRKGVRIIYYSAFLSILPDSVRESIPDGDRFDACSDLSSDCKLFFALGGDGTFLSALTLVRNSGIPVVGVNFGRLGFLTTSTVSDTDSNEWIGELVDGKYRIERRTVLALHCDDMPDGLYPYAVNEVVVQRRDPVMLSIDVSVDGSKLPTYWADGLLVATPTGSTAYSLSLGGPIVRPDAKVLIISPIAPHNLNVRPLIVPDTSIIEIAVNARGHEAMLTMDNRSASIASGQKLSFAKAAFSVNSVALESSNFIGALQEKLFWGEDKRNDRQ